MSLPAVLSMGTNLGDRLENLRGGLAELRRRLLVTALSAVYETDPVGGPPQPSYLNMVVLAEVERAAEALAIALAVEAAQGRVRDVRWGPRSLDVDVITVAGVTSTDPQLTLPHPRAHQRAFVLLPWYDVDPAAVLPGHGPVGELLARLSESARDSGVARRDDLVLV